MTPVEAVEALTADGVIFSTDGKTIRWRNGDGWMKPEVVELIRSGKAAVIASLIEGEMKQP